MLQQSSDITPKSRSSKQSTDGHWQGGNGVGVWAGNAGSVLAVAPDTAAASSAYAKHLMNLEEQQ